jgi:ribonuclease VapC
MVDHLPSVNSRQRRNGPALQAIADWWKGPAGEVAFDALLQRLSIVVAPITPEAATFARSAYQRFGKGTGSPGVLNYGDCLAYGVAMAAGDELLYKRAFSRTDVATANY